MLCFVAFTHYDLTIAAPLHTDPARRNGFTPFAPRKGQGALADASSRVSSFGKCAFFWAIEPPTCRLRARLCSCWVIQLLEFILAFQVEMWRLRKGKIFVMKRRVFWQFPAEFMLCVAIFLDCFITVILQKVNLYFLIFITMFYGRHLHHFDTVCVNARQYMIMARKQCPGRIFNRV